MRPSFLLRGPFAALLIALTAGPAAAAEVSQIEVEIVAVDGAGETVTERESGAAYWYSLNYAITGSDLSGVALTIQTDLPDGLWLTSTVAPQDFTTSCTGSNWDRACTFTISDLDLNSAGGIAGQVRLLVYSRRFQLGHGDTLALPVSLTAAYIDDGGAAKTASATASHTMGFIAYPKVGLQTSVASTFGGYTYAVTRGPNGEDGVSVNYTIEAKNTGTAPLTDVEVTATLPAGSHLLAHFGATVNPVQPGDTVIVFRAPTLGSWPYPNPTTSSYRALFGVRIWFSCEQLATLRDANGAVPPELLQVVSIKATGYGYSLQDGSVASHVVVDETPADNAAAPPNLTSWVCGTGQASFNKRNLSGNVVAGAGVRWFIEAGPPIATTYVTDTVIWDALDPTLDAFYSLSSVSSTAGGAFTTYFCDLSALAVAPAPEDVRVGFLDWWKDDPTLCTVVPPADSSAWAPLTHLFFYAPEWGQLNAPPGYAMPSFAASVYTRTRADAAQDSTFSNTAWYESDLLTPATRPPRTATGKIFTDIVKPRIYPTQTILASPPHASPGEAVQFRVGVHRFNSYAKPLNPKVTALLPKGLIYERAQLLFDPKCEIADQTAGAGTWVPIDYTEDPVLTPNLDGSVTLEWSFGSAQNPFQVSGTCPGGASFKQIEIRVFANVDPNGAFTSGQILNTNFTVSAENATYVGTENLPITVQVPGQMRVEVVPYCEQSGHIGFNARYENTGGEDLTNAIVTFPIPEAFDPSGGTPDTTHFASALFDDPTATLYYEAGGVWSVSPPNDLALVTAVQLVVPTLPAHSGAQNFVVNLVVPAGNGGDNRIHATAAMAADQLTNASSPVSIPFVVDTCPKAMTVHKFFDADRDGAQSAGEPSLQGWRFEVRDQTGALIDARSTNLDGDVTFTLIQGDYAVTEVIPGTTDANLVWSATTADGLFTQSINIGLGDDYGLIFGNACACDDGDYCTNDLCDAVLGCIHNARTCDDGNVCTIDSCDSIAAVCVNALAATTVACDDGDACTETDRCDGAGGCAGVQICNEAPIAQCADVTVLAGAACGAEASVDAGSYDPDGDALTLTQTPAGVFPLGSTSVTLTVSDGVLSDSCVATVTVVDETAPTVVLDGSDPVASECGASYTDAGATASDNCGGDLTASLAWTTDLDVSLPGSYGLTWAVSDAAGNDGAATRIVNVVDTTPPTLTVLGDVPALTECGGSYGDAGATASDVCAGDLTAAIAATSTVDTTAVGTYGVDYQVSDPAGNASSASRQVDVADTAAPDLTLNGAGSVTLECGLEQTYSDAGATATDVCDGPLDVVATGVVDPQTVGSYVIDYTASDASGNASDTARTVEVVDTTPPVPGDDTAEGHENAAITLDVLANDADSDVFTDQYRVGATTAPAGGTLAVNADNTVTYTPNPGHHGADSFTYQVVDGGCGSAWGNVNVNTLCDVRIDTPGQVPLGASNQAIVWIYGSASIDVTQIDTATLELNGVDVDVRVVGKGKQLISYSDRDGDGFLDVKLILDVEGLMVSSGDATLTGWLLDRSCNFWGSTATLDVVDSCRTEGATADAAVPCCEGLAPNDDGVCVAPVRSFTCGWAVQGNGCDDWRASNTLVAADLAAAIVACRATEPGGYPDTWVWDSCYVRNAIDGGTPAATDADQCAAAEPPPGTWKPDTSCCNFMGTLSCGP